MTKPWYDADDDSTFKRALAQYGVAAAGLGVGLLVADITDRLVKTRRRNSLMLRLEPVRVPPAVIAAAFAAQREWQRAEIRQMRNRLRTLEGKLDRIRREL